MIRDSVVGAPTGCWLNDRRVGVRVLVESRIFSFPRRPDWFWGSPISYPMGSGGSFRGEKRRGREADHTPPAIGEVKKIWIYTSTLVYAFMAWCLISLSNPFSCHTLLYSLLTPPSFFYFTSCPYFPVSSHSIIASSFTYASPSA
jgi:hypothetical protein